MTIHYASLDAAFQVHPIKIADWGYILFRETDLTASGVMFFDDIEDPETCRRAAFSGKLGSLIVLTIHGAAMPGSVLLASDRRIGSAPRGRGTVPDEFAQWIDAFDIVYFGQPI
ncbi:hypothetical protein LGN09_31080 [Burkholderia cenocepacia]|uniref:hypothetical protein n=1 Tax=Burkholderia cenocepacia TaxID=95486 RepID=UPI001CF46DD0|nr:hypothetical protein [Burkholderia cenocepacia]MCA8409362.1 hypothetical protein [Burkholderia cenocepacia]